MRRAAEGGAGMASRITRPRALVGVAPALRERLVLTSQIALVLAVISAIGVAANLHVGDPAMVVGSASLLVVTAAVPTLVAGGRFGAARAVLVVGSPALMLGPAVLGPALLGDGIRLANLAALPYAVLTMSLLPSLVFEPSTERAPRAVCNVYLLAILLTHDLLIARLAGHATPPLNVKLVQVALWILMLASLRFAEQAGGRGER
jgi:hypothetical protein